MKSTYLYSTSKLNNYQNVHSKFYYVKLKNFMLKYFRGEPMRIYKHEYLTHGYFNAGNFPINGTIHFCSRSRGTDLLSDKVCLCLTLQLFNTVLLYVLEYEYAQVTGDLFCENVTLAHSSVVVCNYVLPFFLCLKRVCCNLEIWIHMQCHAADKRDKA